MFVIYVIPDLPEITAHPDNKEVRKGSHVTLSCDANGNPSPSISWTKNGVLLNKTGDPRISFTQQNRKLTMKNVSEADNGEYQCVAINLIGNATSNGATLDVQCKYIIHLICQSLVKRIRKSPQKQDYMAVLCLSVGSTSTTSVIQWFSRAT